MAEKILVTGGAGFIGSHLVDRLIAESYSVAVLDNLSTGSIDNVNKKARFYEGDIRNDAAAVFEKEKPDYLIHHAAQINVRKSIDDTVDDAEQNIIGSLKLFELCKEYEIKKIIFASSGGTVYGNPEKFPVKEDVPLRPLNPYGIAKAAIENYLFFYHENFGIDYVSLRYGNVYGPRQNPKGEAGVIAIFIVQMLRGETPIIWGDGKQTRDFVYVDDVVEANLNALCYSGPHHIINIGSGQETSIKEIFSILKPIPDSENPKYNFQYKENIPRVCLDSSLAMNELGWKGKVELEEGIRKTVDWFKKI